MAGSSFTALMNVSSFIANRVAFNRQKSFSRIIIRLAAAATALSVAAMIVTISFVNGFQQAVSNKVFSFWGHLRVQQYEEDKSLVAEETMLAANDTVLQTIHSMPGIQQVQAFATKSAVIEKNKEIEGILFKGVESNYAFTNLQPFLQEGKWISFEDTLYSKQVVISRQIADELKIKVNDSVNIYFISPDNTSSFTRKLQVCGIYKTGIAEYDKLFAIGDIRLLRRVFKWRNGEIGGYEVFLQDYHTMDGTRDLLHYALPQEWICRTTRELYPNIFDWLQIQDVNRNVIFIVMSIVAIINLVTCLIILVLERTRMTGVLKAIGSTNWTIQKIFLQHATIIAGAGILIGLIFGGGLCLLQQRFGFLKLKESEYYVSVAPVHMIGWEVAAICGGTLLVCFLSLLLPTLLVRTIKPVKAIQFR